MERKQQHDDLLQEWYNARLEYDDNGEFVWDGPSNWEIFNDEPIRILFLSKESRLGFHPSDQSNTIYGQRPINMISWAWIIQQLNNDRTKQAIPPGNEELKNLFHNNYSRIAEIDIKKKNEELNGSLTSDIEKYALQDRDYIRKQISLIDPHVIICGNTFSSYEIIYEKEFENNEVKLLIDGECSAYKHENRLVVKFYHPAYTQIPDGKDAYIRLWHEVLDNGKVFENFNW